MATERDLSALLPTAPRPRADRREAAIATAMRRFDGDSSVPARAPVPPRKFLSGRPQVAMLVTAALVGVIGLPLWLSGEQRAPIPNHRMETADSARPAESLSTADVSAGPPAAVEPTRAPPGIVAPVSPPTTAIASSALQRARAPVADADSVFEPQLAPAPAPPPPPPPPPPPVAAPAALAAAEEANDASEIVVTGSRIAGRAAKAQQRYNREVAGPGNWNACTIDDPRRNLEACRKILPGTAGPAATLAGDGLTRAWRGDIDGAIGAFDRAIAASPKFAPAWLNRGLARAAEGDDARALADLDKAVKYAPSDPRGWFQRSLILRRTGKVARADADAKRAAELDQRYDDLINR